LVGFEGKCNKLEIKRSFFENWTNNIASQFYYKTLCSFFSTEWLRG